MSPTASVAFSDRPEQALMGFCKELLDTAYETIHGSKIEEGLDHLVLGLRELWTRAVSSVWKALARACLAHPLCEILHQDPFTWRAFSKPRGYAGDAELLDYIYGVDEGWAAPAGTSAVGQRIFAHHTAHGPSPKAVRVRRRVLARLVDETSAAVSRPRILSVAAGHLREAGLSAAIRQGRTGEYVALDQDGKSLETVERLYGRFGVVTVAAGIRRLLMGRLALGRFDLIYSAGLYDYLPQTTARHLTRVLFDMLRPGGRLLVANFLPGIRDVGYMESFMDWHLVYRTTQELRDLAKPIDASQAGATDIWTEENDNVAFLLVTKC
jgi:SAM-dependent methyltransferase